MGQGLRPPLFGSSPGLYPARGSAQFPGSTRHSSSQTSNPGRGPSLWPPQGNLPIPPLHTEKGKRGSFFFYRKPVAELKERQKKTKKKTCKLVIEPSPIQVFFSLLFLLYLVVFSFRLQGCFTDVNVMYSLFVYKDVLRILL